MITSATTQANLRVALAQRESSNNPFAQNTLGYVGKYQFGAAALEDLGYLKPGTFKRSGNRGIQDSSNWTGKGGVGSVNDYFNNEAAQDNSVNELFEINYKRGVRSGSLSANSTEQEIASYQAAAHLKGSGGADNYFNGGREPGDAYGTQISEYAQIGQTAAQESVANNSKSGHLGSAGQLVYDRNGRVITPDGVVSSNANNPAFGVSNSVTGNNRRSESANGYSAAEGRAKEGYASFEPTPNRFQQFSTMTYSVSLYVITPKQYSELMLTAKKDVSKLTLLIQSGGVNDTRGAKRSPAMPLDYYLDNLQLKGLVSGTSTGLSTNQFELNFTVTEPAGITFLDNLNRAIQLLNEEFGLNPSEISYASQLYLMVIRFYGYDENGQQINGSLLPQTDGLSDASAVSEKFIPFMFSNISFRLKTDIVEYKCEAYCPQTQINHNNTHGVVPHRIELNGRSLHEVLVGNYVDPASPAIPPPKNVNSIGLAETLNQKQKRLVACGKQEFADIYEIKFEPNKGFETAKTVPPGTYDFGHQAFPKIADQARSNNLSTEDGKTFSVNAGMSISHLIDSVVRSSSFISDQYLKVKDVNGKESIKFNVTKNNGFILWYKILSQCEPQEWDNIRNDYSFHITYVVTEFPVVPEGDPNYSVPNHFDVHKRYNYWFTGENTEVTSFEQDYNFLWFTSINESRGANRSLETNQREVGGKRLYQVNPGESDKGAKAGVNEPAANVASTLYSPGDQATAVIDIIGDPDYILQSEVFYSAKYNLTSPFFKKPYLQDGSINFDAAEVNFEINYNTIVDYDLSTGLANVKAGNVGYDASTQKAGVSKYSFVYRANIITSQFKGGKFTQRLEGTVRFFDAAGKAVVENVKTKKKEDTTPVVEFCGTAEKPLITPN